MKKYLTIIAYLFIVGNVALGQGYTFKVLANKGDNQVKSGADWKALKTGASLAASDELKVSDNAYLGLVHSSGKTLELKSAGNHKVKDLAAKVNSGGSSVASKYADFVLSKMSAESKKNRLSATGAVTREVVLDDKGAISVFMPNSVNVFNDKAMVRWGMSDGVDENTYVVTFKNMFDDVLLSVETNNPNFELDMTNERIAKENVVLVSVTDKDDDSKKSDVYAIKKLSGDDAQKVKDVLNDLMSEVEEETALNKYILAGFYEENNLIVDALTSYEEAIRLAPDVESYQEAYEEFLIRNDLGN